MLIVLWGLPAERPLALVRSELEQLGAHHVLLNQHEVLETEAHLSVGESVGGWLTSPRLGHLDLAQVTALYVRPYDTCAVPAVAAAGTNSQEWRHAMQLDDLLWAWADVTTALVVNRASAMTANGSKPYQLELIRQAGFLVPETLVTTDPDAARDFWQAHGDVIYKSVSGVRSIVSRLGPEHAGRLDDVAHCPTQLQAFVPGVDHRVHVVGDELFACEIASEAVDYRYRGACSVEIRSCSLPRDVEDRCRAMVAEMGLSVAGIDLRRSPQGEWYCFEVNPSPGFDYFQSRSGQPIARALARLLISGATAPIGPIAVPLAAGAA